MKTTLRTQKIKLTIIGRRVLKKPSVFLDQHEQERSCKSKQSLQEGCALRELKFSRSPVDGQIKDAYSAIEDPRISRFTHNKLLVVEKNILLLTLLLIFLGMIKIESDVIYPSGAISGNLMLIMSCIIAILVVLVTVRKVLRLQLEIDQRKVYIHKQNRRECSSSLGLVLGDREEAAQLLAEILAILPHPISYFHGVTYTINSAKYQADLTYSVNDLLSVLMLVKIYLVFRSLVALTIYSSPRMVRLCRHNSLQYSFFFSIKCLQQEHPLILTFTVLHITLFLFAFGFRVTEGDLYYLNQQVLGQPNGFQSYGNCVWYTFITMTSIGYGDYVPITILGRVLASILAIFGVTLNSFLVVALSEYLKMKTEQVRSHTTLKRLRQYRVLQEQASVAMVDVIRVTQEITKNSDNLHFVRRMKPQFQKLKRRLDQSKAEVRRVKAIMSQENKTELMIREFQLVKDNFKEFYLHQRKIKEKIQRIEQQQGSRLSQVRQNFIKEIDSIILKYNQ